MARLLSDQRPRCASQSPLYFEPIEPYTHCPGSCHNCHYCSNYRISNHTSSGALTVRLNHPYIRNITVPTLNLVTDRNIGAIDLSRDSSQAIYVRTSEPWDRAMVQALLSNTALSWKIPSQCYPGCQYNVSYSAAALRCSDLDPYSISGGVPPEPTIQDPPVAYLSCYDHNCATTGILNFTVQEPLLDVNVSAAMSAAERDRYGITLAYIPFSNNNGDFSSSDAGSARGSVCTFYNATYLAQVSYANSMQVNAVSVSEYHDPLNTTYKWDYILYDGNSSNPVGKSIDDSFAPGVGPNINLLTIAHRISSRRPTSLP
jgi:hypothetical protein